MRARVPRLMSESTRDDADTGDPDGPQLARIFMTPKVREARLAEEVLERAGVPFRVEVEPFGRTLLGSPRNGLSFYVAGEDADRSADLLRDAGLEHGVVSPDDDTPR